MSESSRLLFLDKLLMIEQAREAIRDEQRRDAKKPA
jgi:hypothetical protein